MDFPYKIGTVVIFVGNVQLTFSRDKYGVKLISKSKDAQVYDSANCWVPKKLFLQACQQATKILHPEKFKKKSKIKGNK